MTAPVDILIVGHSWVEGAFKGKEKDIRRFLESKGIPVGDVRVISESASAIIYSEQMIKGLFLTYDIIITLTGVNDSSSNPTAVSRKLVSLYETALQFATGQVFVCNIPPYKKNPRTIPLVNEALAEAMPQEKIIDLFSFMKPKGDSLHPADYRPVFEFVLLQVAQRIKTVKTAREPPGLLKQ